MPHTIRALLQNLSYHAYMPHVGIAVVLLFLAIVEDHTLLPSVSELCITFVALFCGFVFVIAPGVYILGWVKDVLESLGEVVVYYKEQKEADAKAVVERPQSYGFEYSDEESEEEVQQRREVKPAAPTSARVPAMVQRPPQNWSIASEPTPPKPSTVIDPRAASTSPAGLFNAGHTSYSHSRSRPTWTPENTPPSSSSLFDPNPALATPASGSFPATSPATSSFTSSTSGHTPYPRLVAPPTQQMRPNSLLLTPPTPHYTSGILGPSPAPKRALNHFSPEGMYIDMAIREALFKKPGRPVREREGMFDSKIGMCESVGEAGLRRVRLRGGWRYVPVSEGHDGEYGGQGDEDKDKRHGRNVFKEAEKKVSVMSEKAREKQKAMADEEG
jgi:hypothetical protein